MSKERVTVDELLEAAKTARDLKYDLDILAAEAIEEAKEKEATYNALVAKEAMSLGEHMLAMNRPVSIGRFIAHHGYKIEKQYPKVRNRGKKLLTTPVLMKITQEVDGLEVMHGWRFATYAARDRSKKTKPWEVLGVRIFDHTEVVGSDVPPIETEEMIRLRSERHDGKIVSIPFFYTRNDLNDPELLDIYALLRLARQELGDKKAK
jgi:hypothetical protein